MFTVCPKCSLKLVVTAADLRVAQGYVRCSRCSNVFNALIGLSDEQQAVLAREEQAAAASQQPAPDRPPDSSAGPDIRAAAPISSTAPGLDTAATDVSEVLVEPRLDAHGLIGQSEPAIVRNEISLALDATDEFELEDIAPPAHIVAAPHPLSPSTAASSSGPAPASVPHVSEPGTSDSTDIPGGNGAASEGSADRTLVPSEWAGSTGDLVLDERSAAADTGPPARHLARVLQFGVGGLALLLAAQVINHYRARLADTDWLRPPLTAIYAGLGIPLVPRWDVGAYEVRQLGAVAGPEGSGVLTVRASIKNTASRAQPLPLLRVTVQDRFGNRVGARDVPPGGYLPQPSANHDSLGAGQRVDAEIALVDPGPNVVGFEIDACLADAAGRVSCANDGSGTR